MTPYKGNSTFTIPRGTAALLDALTAMQREYEDAKMASERATQTESDCMTKKKTLKRDLINALTASGVAVTRAEKEYVDAEDWKQNEIDLVAAQDKKRAADHDESIARQRMLTLRAAIVPVTVLETTKPYGARDAVLAIAEDDMAFSADPSVAHNA